MRADSGFHEGELAVQRRAAVQDDAARLAGMLDGAALSGGIARFLEQRSFLVITARDAGGRVWTSPLVGRPGFAVVETPTRIAIHSILPSDDPLRDLPAGQQLGLSAVEFASRGRVRINGTLTGTADDTLRIDVEQAFGNCPRYIRRRALQADPDLSGASAARLETELSPGDLALLNRAETFFLGTTHPRRGADASHRGGPAGFVRAEGRHLWWPDYPGNNLFNSLGNLAVDPAAALLFIDFATGQTLQLSGTAELSWHDRPALSAEEPDTGRILRFALDVAARRRLGARDPNSA